MARSDRLLVTVPFDELSFRPEFFPQTMVRKAQEENETGKLCEKLRNHANACEILSRREIHCSIRTVSHEIAWHMKARCVAPYGATILLAKARQDTT